MSRLSPMQPSSEQAALRQILGVPLDATEEQIRQAYLNLVNVWHPDRFEAPHLKALGEEKLKEINRAYESLEGMLQAEPVPPPPVDSNPSPPPAPMRPVEQHAWKPAAAALATVVVLAGGFYMLIALTRSRTPQKPAAPPSVASAPAAATPAPVPRPSAPQIAEASARPETGLLEKPQVPFGEGRLIITNDSHLDAYVQLMMKATPERRVRTIYIRSGESFSVAQLPVGQFTLHANVGRGWMAGSARFAADRQDLDPVGPLAYLQIQTPTGVQSDVYTVTLNAQEPKTVFRIPNFRTGEEK
jgi:hypothetical protein